MSNSGTNVGIVMDEVFLIFLAGFVLSALLHILALNRKKLAQRFGETRGRRIGNIVGIASGWLLFICWVGFWFVPQPSFTLPMFKSHWIIIPIIALQIPLIHLMVGVLFLMIGSYFGLSAVSKLSLTVSQTQLPNKLVTDGIYSKCRHPQYLGGLLAHIGVSLLISALYSLLMTPFVFFTVYVMSYAEERQLVRMFGERYQDYREDTPMFLPLATSRMMESE